MKVQGINNQNNLSHKAYFKPNAEIKKLCDISAKTYEMVQAYKNFKNICPGHEIEIIESQKSKIPGFINYKLANNFTKNTCTVRLAEEYLDRSGGGVTALLINLVKSAEQGCDFWKVTFLKPADRSFSFLKMK